MDTAAHRCRPDERRLSHEGRFSDETTILIPNITTRLYAYYNYTIVGYTESKTQRPMDGFLVKYLIKCQAKMSKVVNIFGCVCIQGRSIVLASGGGKSWKKIAAPGPEFFIWGL